MSRPILIAVLSLLIAGCLTAASPPSGAPQNFTVSPGENQVVLRWDAQPGLVYWAFFEPGTTVSTEDNAATVRAGFGSSPAVITGLVNGTQYAFLMDAHNNDSKGGPSSAIVTATPRLLSPSIPWTVGTPLSTHDLRGIAFGNNYYVAVGDAASVFTAPYDYPSPGGVTAWSQVTSLPVGVGVDLTAVIYDGGRFVALGADGSVIRSRSNTDLVDWDPAVGMTGTSGMNAMAYGNGIYVAVGAGGVIERNTSAGVVSGWAAQASGTSQDLYGVSYVNGIFIAVGAAGTLLTSADGATWTAHATATPGSLRHVAYGVGTGAAAVYVAVGDAGAIVSSPDAVTWTPQTIPTTESFYTVCFGPDLQFIAAGTNGTVAYSLTGADGSWSVGNAGSIDLYAMVPNGVFIAVGPAGTNVSGK